MPGYPPPGAAPPFDQQRPTYSQNAPDSFGTGTGSLVTYSIVHSCIWHSIALTHTVSCIFCKSKICELGPDCLRRKTIYLPNHFYCMFVYSIVFDLAILCKNTKFLKDCFDYVCNEILLSLCLNLKYLNFPFRLSFPYKPGPSYEQNDPYKPSPPYGQNTESNSYKPGPSYR